MKENETIEMNEMNDANESKTFHTPESVRCNWFRHKAGAGAAYFYAVWTQALLDMISLQSSYDDDYMPELKDAKEKVDELLDEIREELIIKYAWNKIPREVIHTLLNIYELCDEKDEQASNLFFDGLYETDLINEKVAEFNYRLECACYDVMQGCEVADSVNEKRTNELEGADDDAE